MEVAKIREEAMSSGAIKTEMKVEPSATEVKEEPTTATQNGDETNGVEDGTQNAMECDTQQENQTDDNSNTVVSMKENLPKEANDDNDDDDDEDIGWGMDDRPYSAQFPQIGKVISGPGAKRTYTPYVMPKLLFRHRGDIDKAKKFAKELSVKGMLVRQQASTVVPNPQTAAADALTLQQNMAKLQAVALMARVYVGSVNYDIKEDTMRECFQPFGPIKGLSMPIDPMTGKHKGFTFVEYEFCESASLAIEQMNGHVLGGRSMKVGRPTNLPQALPYIQKLSEEAKAYNRIFVASIHPQLTETDVKSVFEAFGPIVSIELQYETPIPGVNDMENARPHKGCCYIEYETREATLESVSSMNLFDLAGQFLRVGRAVTPPHTMAATMAGVPGSAPPQPEALPAAAAVAAASITAKINQLQTHGVTATRRGFGVPSGSPTLPIVQSLHSGLSPVQASGLPPPSVMIPKIGVGRTSQLVSKARDEPLPVSVQSDEPSLEAEEGVGASNEAARRMRERLTSRRPLEKKVLVLRNMVGVEDVDENLESEVTEECTKYGTVTKVIIYQERQGESDDADVIVKIFVEFETQAAQEEAARGLNKRWFAGRIVVAEAYDPLLYESKDLSG